MKALLCGAGGYWGKNVLRNLLKFSELDISCVEPNQSTWDILPDNVDRFVNLSEALNHEIPDIALICTPINNHFLSAVQLLTNNVHCLVQKPLTTDVKQAEELIRLADLHKVVLATSHTFLFNPAIQKLKELIDSGDLGRLQFLHSTRFNLGLFSRTNSVIEDLGPHDFSILNFLTSDKKWESISASGSCHSNTKLIDTCNITVNYKDNFQAYIGLSWISPKKIRQIIVAGDKKMAIYDDTNNDEKLKIYDAGFNEDENSRFSYRKGAIEIPKLDDSEAIYNEIKYFLDCVKGQKINDISGPEQSLEVVKMIHAARTSVNQGGAVYCS